MDGKKYSLMLYQYFNGFSQKKEQKKKFCQDIIQQESTKGTSMTVGWGVKEHSEVSLNKR